MKTRRRILRETGGRADRRAERTDKADGQGGRTRRPEKLTGTASTAAGGVPGMGTAWGCGRRGVVPPGWVVKWWGYSYRSAIIGSTFAARRAGM